MITGAHAIIYSTDPDADRELLRDVFELPHVDVGHGWLIFALPPAEVAVHPSDRNDLHELFFMCADVHRLVKTLTQRGISCSPVVNQGWGSMTRLTLPGGGKLGVYQPRHPRPVTKDAKPAKSRARKKSGRKTARR